MAERRAVIKNADMAEEMQQDAVDSATTAIEKYNIEKVCMTNQHWSRTGVYRNKRSFVRIFK